MKKKLVLLLSLVLCMIFMVGCGNSKSDDSAKKIDEGILSTCENNTEQNFTTWNETDFSTEINPEQVSDEMMDKYNQWIDLQKKLGKMKSQSKTETKVSDSTITCTIRAKYQHGMIAFTATFDETGTFQDVNVDEEFTMAQTMEKALLNTLMGMGTVFVVLILMSLIIGAFGKVFENKAKKQKAEPEPVAAPVIKAPVQTQESVDVTDDTELVAVITAAIMASLGEEAPAEGLVVRSIRRRNADKWKNA